MQLIGSFSAQADSLYFRFDALDDERHAETSAERQIVW
ncbi:hypothetical protein L902_00805 [Agrobacterium radiobacter DSM 30147]|nr:hypothetical protein L902_00805 [Agrobacterium radiobacter DSM 30147]